MQRVYPDAPEIALCPLCMRFFDSPDDFSIEDVPPQSIGGRPLLLSCRACNSAAGYKLDHYLRHERDDEEIAEGKREARVRLEHSGHVINAVVKIGERAFNFGGLPTQSNPSEHTAFFESLEQLAETTSLEWNLKMTLSLRGNSRKAAIAWLRVGYLYAFAAFGHRFVARHILDPVRDQLAHPEKDTLKGLVRRVEQPIGGDGIAIISSPPQMRSALVRIGTRYIFLPWFPEADSFYERLAEPSNGPVQFDGWHLDLPRAPVFALDFRPDLLGQTLTG